LQRLLPAYGDGADETSALARHVLHHYFAVVEQFRNPRGGPHRPGLLVWTLHDHWADCVGALPDGRRRGQALVSSIGPRGEAAIDSPTSVVIDATAFDHWHCAGALTLNLRFEAATVRGEEGRAALEDLLRVYFERGGMQVQVNVVDSEELRAAQAAPEAYAGLLVRVSGFVARFVELCPRIQGEIISRTELRAGR
ncbi:MAG: glycine radical domain-containing protein, partial [Armatimonadota bacterium]